MSARVFAIAATDSTFLWSGCRRCFYGKVALGVKRPQGPFPTVFPRLAAIQSSHFFGGPTSAISPDLPAGEVRYEERFVKSSPIWLPGRRSAVIIRGRLDLGLHFEKDTYGVVDLKTSLPGPELLDLYRPQLGLYALALENPAPGAFGLTPVSHLGLKILSPELMVEDDSGLAIRFGSEYVPIERDDTATLALLDEMLEVLEQPGPPEASPRCTFCGFKPMANVNSEEIR